jgi:aflatoxin B1 aldehyde reductase
MPIKTVIGGGGFNPWGELSSPDALTKVFSILKSAGVTTIDTARLYPGSEEMIGATPGHETFTIDTKVQGDFGEGCAKKDDIIAAAQDSLNKCKISQFDIFYMHAPSRNVPFEESAEGINECYKKGQFKRFGLSNFTAEEVQRMYDICKDKGYVVPSVYQGNYNAVARKAETLLFPILRKLGFAFYAYSPIAGGFLTKKRKQIEDGVGRFSTTALGGLYRRLYNRPSFLDALTEWNAVAEEEGVSTAELAYRWVAYNSALKEELGDAVIFGVSKIAQVEETTAWLAKGGLSEKSVQRIEAIWKSVEREAPVDNFQG